MRVEFGDCQHIKKFPKSLKEICEIAEPSVHSQLVKILICAALIALFLQMFLRFSCCFSTTF